MRTGKKCPQHGVLILILFQGVPREEENEKRGETAEDEQVLLRSRHLVRAEAVVGVVLETRDGFRLSDEGVLRYKKRIERARKEEKR